jgi:hypothetical protein
VDEQEYEKFMAYLYSEYFLSQSTRRFHKHFYGKDFGHWGWEWERLVKASNLLHYINHHCSDQEEIYRTIREERITQLSSEVLEGARINRNMLEESGLLEVYDSFYADIVRGMKVEHMPSQEFEVMRQLGSNNPERDLSAMIHITKSRRMYELNDLQITFRLKDLEEKLALQEKKLRDQENNQPKKSRRWFKGLGQIAQGSALSIANIALAMGALAIPVGSETAGWGAIVSSITGVGMVLNGVGEFKGE